MNIIRKFCRWYLRDTIHHYEDALRSAADRHSYQRNRANMFCKQVEEMSARVGHIRKWRNSRSSETNTWRFIYDYIRGGSQVASDGGNRWSSTGGVHPASRWGIKDFEGRDWS